MTKEQNISHNITKFIKNYSSSYYCKEHDTFYATRKLLKKQHPDLTQHLIRIEIVNNTQEENTCKICKLEFTSDGHKKRHDRMVHPPEEITA